MYKILFYLLFIGLPMLVISCRESHSHGTDDLHAMESDSKEHNDEVHLTQVQMENIGISYESITPRNIRSTVKLNGRVELPSDGIAIATSPLEGQVEQVHVLPGNRVRQGQVLFTIRNIDLIDWQEQRLKAQADLEFLNKEIERQQFLSEQNITAVRVLEQLLTEKKKKESEEKAIEAKLQVAGITTDPSGDLTSIFKIRSPQAGIVQHLKVHKGSYVTSQTELVRILSNHHLRIHLFAFENDITRLSEGQTIDFFVQSRPNALRKARIAWINSLVNEENNSYEIHADIIGDKSGLVPGEYVEARVIDREAFVPTLPLEAITYDKGLTYVFVKKEEMDGASHFQKVQVILGEKDLGFVEIRPLDAIPDHALVATNGAFFLMAQSKKDEGEGGGHEH